MKGRAPSLQNIAFLFLLFLSASLSIMVEYKESVYGATEGNERSPLVAPTAPSEEEVDVLDVQAVEEVSNEINTTEHERMVSAGVASGVVGLLMGGPFFGILLGFGTAWAHDKEGAAGDAARAVGDVALVAKNKAKQVDAKHHLVLKSKNAINQAWQRAKEVDRRHNVLEKTKGFVVFSWEKILEINREHRVIERSVEAIGRALGYILTQIAEKIRQQDGDSSDSWTEVQSPPETVVEEAKVNEQTK